MAAAVVIASGDRLPSPGDFALFSGLPAFSLPAVIPLALLFNGFGEETGWRGFALERLQARYGPLKGALLLALIWGGWHLTYNLGSATTASRGTIGAVTTTCTMVWTVVLWVRELDRKRTSSLLVPRC